MIDENVHFRHTVRLINALIRTHKPYELILFPDERHGPRRLEDRVYLEERCETSLSKHSINPKIKSYDHTDEQFCGFLTRAKRSTNES